MPAPATDSTRTQAAGMRIAGLGMYVPTRVLSNADLEKMVETSDEWITARTGIRERRIAAENETASEMGAAAARQALETSGVRAADLDLILVATATPDTIFPSTACHIQRKIGAGRCPAFDIQAACSGFLFVLITAQQYLASGRYRNILIVGTERLSSVVDWQDRTTCVLFGDGAGAAVLTRDATGVSGLLDYDFGADGNDHEILYLPNTLPPGLNCTGPIGGELQPGYIKMLGQETFKRAVGTMAKSCQLVMKRSGVTVEDLTCVISHQANMRIIDALADRLKVPKEKCFVNVERYGNMSAACIPVALSEAREHYGLQRGDKILFVAFGGGLTWASCLLKW